MQPQLCLAHQPVTLPCPERGNLISVNNPLMSPLSLLMSRLGGISALLLLYTYLVSSDEEITRQREKELKVKAGLKQVCAVMRSQWRGCCKRN